MAMTRDAAEVFAAQALAWLAQDDGRLATFLAWSGESPDGLRRRIADPGLLLAVIDYLMADESLLIQACAALGVSPLTPAAARAALPGGDDPHWT